MEEYGERAKEGEARGNERALEGLILTWGGGKGGHHSGRSTMSVLPGDFLPLEEEDRG
jgi:hypothetical protein